jgi:hypothetical protein
MKFGNSGLVVIISAAHYLPYIKGEDQSEYSLSLHIIDLSIIMDIKKWENLVWKKGKDILKQ